MGFELLGELEEVDSLACPPLRTLALHLTRARVRGMCKATELLSPSTMNTQPSTREPAPFTLNPQPSTLNLRHTHFLSSSLSLYLSKSRERE